MTYNTIAAMAQNEQLKLRVTACAAEQGSLNPPWWADTHMWQVAATPSWDDQWEYALNVDPNRENIGADEAVITDPDILTSVQTMILAERAQGGTP